jgi:hypothetical protein
MIVFSLTFFHPLIKEFHLIGIQCMIRTRLPERYPFFLFRPSKSTKLTDTAELVPALDAELCISDRPLMTLS